MKTMNTKTSETNPIYVVGMVPPGEQGGWVAIAIAPGKKTRGTFVRWERDLDLDLDRLKVLGVTTLVPFLEDDELQGLNIPNLVEAAEARGLSVRRFPFHDVGVPVFDSYGLTETSPCATMSARDQFRFGIHLGRRALCRFLFPSEKSGRQRH